MSLLICLIVFWAALYFLGNLAKLERYGIEIDPFILVWRIEKLKDLIFNTPGVVRNVVSTLSVLGYILAPASAVFGLWYLASKTINQVLGYSNQPAAIPLIPYVTIPFDWALIATIVVLAVVHEAFHGLTALSMGVRVKNAGLAVLFALIGFFVELEDEDLKKVSRRKRFRIYSAGSVGNYIVAGLTFILIASMFIGFPREPYGVYIVEPLKGQPSEGVLRAGDIIIALNDTRIRSYLELARYMLGTKPGEDLVITTERGNFTVRLAENPRNRSIGFMGLKLYTGDYYKPRINVKGELAVKIYTYLSLNMWINLGLAMFNFLPALPADGGKIVEMYLEGRRKILYAISIAVWGTLGLSMLLFYLPGG